MGPQRFAGAKMWSGCLTAAFGGPDHHRAMPDLGRLRPVHDPARMSERRRSTNVGCWRTTVASPSGAARMTLLVCTGIERARVNPDHIGWRFKGGPRPWRRSSAFARAAAVIVQGSLSRPIAPRQMVRSEMNEGSDFCAILGSGGAAYRATGRCSKFSNRPICFISPHAPAEIPLQNRALQKSVRVRPAAARCRNLTITTRERA